MNLDYSALRDLIATMPDVESSTDAEVAAWCNDTAVERIRSSMSGDEIFQQTDAVEFGSLTDAKKAQWLSFCARSTIDPAAAANVAFVGYIFGSSSTTLANLGVARMETVSRVAAEGLPPVAAGHIFEARAQ